MTDAPHRPTRVEPRPPPPLVTAEGGGGMAVNALPAVGALGSVLLVTSTATGGSGTVRLLAGALVVLTTLGFVVVQVDRQRGQRRRQRRDARAAYLAHLATVRHRVDDADRAQHERLVARHPDPADPVALLARASDPDAPAGPDADAATCGPLRWGTGTGDPDVELVAPPPPEAEVDPVGADALRRLVEARGSRPDRPLLLAPADLGGVDVVGVDARAVVRALVVQAAVTTPPGGLRVAVTADPVRLPAWDWAKWLPHTAAGPAAPGGPHRLLVHDGDHPPPPPRPGTTVLRVVAVDGGSGVGPGPRVPGVARLVLGPGGDRLLPAPPAAAPVTGRADRCGPAVAEVVARRLAGQAAAGATGRPGSPAAGVPGGVADPTTAVVRALGLRDPGRVDPTAPGGPWLVPLQDQRLRVPIGTDPAGELVHLDLEEAARGGSGPHGLVVGATGSGKSELLRTLVLGLAAGCSPERLNLVLVDYKGGATFTGLARLPHTSALITNLAAEAALVERMADALAGELVRRQELLRRAGPFASRHELEAARARAGPGPLPSVPSLPSLPSLLVVVDEFSELLAAQPGFVDLFGTLGRLGRSLGVHLLLASQRLEEGRLRGLESHLSYRVALRTASAAESRAVLGAPDAASLPATPGAAYLRTGPDAPARFTAAHVSGPAEHPDGTARAGAPARGRAEQPRLVPFALVPTNPGESGSAAPGPDAPVAPATGGPTLLDVVVARLAPHGPAAHPVWLPPLDRSPALGDLLGGLRVDPDRGLAADGPPGRPGPVLPLGVIDRPREQRRDPLLVDLGAAGGHLVAVGGPRSGTSTLLRTAVLALVLTSPPSSTHCHVLDLGGGALADLAGLPHVAAVAGRSDPEVVRRVLATLGAELDRREAAGPGAPDHPRLVLVVDGWAGLREGDDAWEEQATSLAARGPGLGLHVLAAARRWADLRPRARDLFGHRVELRLGDPLDSEVDRRAASAVPRDRPGRGLVHGGHHVLVAVPREREDGADLVARVAAAARGPRAPRVQLLPALVGPELVHRAAAVDPTGDPARGPLLRLGLDEVDLAPAGLDPRVEPHLVALGDAGSGRTGLLRTLAAEVARTRPADRAQLVVVDPRRTLLGDLPPDHVLAHLGDDDTAQETIAELAAFLRTRLPPRHLDPGTLRRRGWWRGAEVWVLVDDHDLVTAAAGAAGHGDPLLPLLPLLPRAPEVGLHLVLARRAGGAARALHEPLLRTLRELGAPGLLLASGAEDGPLLGLRPGPAPPGRARLAVRGRAVRVVQLTWTPPATPVAQDRRDGAAHPSE